MNSETCPLRFVVFHLHPSSARLRFLYSEKNTICFPMHLPALSAIQTNAPAPFNKHPSQYLMPLCESIDVAPQELNIETGFRCWVEVPSGDIPVFAVRAKMEDPFLPPEGLQWIELPDSFKLIPIERDILLQIYRWLLE